MTDRDLSIQDELVSAGRGVVALIIGDRKVPGYFDFSQRGLVGSFIAVLAVTGFSAGVPMLLGLTSGGGSIFRAVSITVLMFAMQVGFMAIVLRQLKRMDGLVPYLVADNWATSFITLAISILSLVGIGSEFLMIPLAILVIIIEINICRLIVTLSPLQIAMFLVAQLVGVSIGLLVIGVVFPLSPAELASLSSQPG